MCHIFSLYLKVELLGIFNLSRSLNSGISCLMEIHLRCILFFLIPFTGWAQETNLLIKHAESLSAKSQYDSAILVFNNALISSKKENNKKAEASINDKLAEIMFQNGRMEEMNAYNSSLLTLATQQKDTVLLINAYNRNGLYNVEIGKAKEAEDYFQKVLSLGLEKKKTNKTAEVYSNLGSNYLATGDKNKSIEWFFKALKIYEQQGNEKGQGETNSNISSVYYLMGNINEAINYQKKSIDLRERTQDFSGLVITNLNIGQLYLIQNNLPLSLQHLQKSVGYAEKVNNPKLKASAYAAMSAYYNKTKDFSTALNWHNKAIPLYEELDSKQQLSRLYVSAGMNAHATNDSVKALNYYMKALDLAKLLNNKENISNANEKLSIFYQDRNQPEKALQYYKQHISYRDSIASTSNLAKIEEVRAQFETEKKDNEIHRLFTSQQIQKLEIEKQNAIISGNVAEAERIQNEIDLLAQNQAVKDLKIQQQEEELKIQSLLAKTNEQQLLLSEKEQLLQERQLKNAKTVRNFILGGIGLLLLLGYFLFNRYQLRRRIHEQEALLSIRNNIARDLHDKIGSTLTGIKILSEVSIKNVDKNQPKAVSFMHNITEQTITAQQDISDIVWAINPDNDKVEDLIIRMREFTSQTLEPKGILTKMTIDEKALFQTLDMQKRREIFLLFREAVNNIAKYAEATEVEISLQKMGNSLQMKISDNGIGFDPTLQTSSNGLKNMKARAKSMNGNLEIQSESGKGSAIVLTLPTT